MPKKLAYPKTPELDKMKAVKVKSQAIGEFIDWLQSEKKVQFGSPHVHGPTCRGWDKQRGRYNPDYPECCEANTGEFIPLHLSIEKLLAEHFEIDLVKVENERRAILDYIRAEGS